MTKRPATLAFYVALVFVFFGALLFEYFSVQWLTGLRVRPFLRTDLIELLPLDAFLVGALAGYLLADQTLADERMAAREGGGGAKGGQEAGGTSLLKSAIANAAVATLILAVVLPPSVLNRITDRLQHFEGAGFKFSFAGQSDASLADAIRTASTPRSQWTGDAPSAQGGFVPIRLETMRELTYPPKTASENPRLDVFERAADFIQAEPGDALANSPDRGFPATTRRVQRDRALLWEIEKAQSDGRPLEEVRSRLEALGRAQEAFLALFAQHVECIAGFIGATKDRRFVDYRSLRLVQGLFVTAHAWSKYDKRVALERRGGRDGGPGASASMPVAGPVAAANTGTGSNAAVGAASSQPWGGSGAAPRAEARIATAVVQPPSAANGAQASIEGDNVYTQLGNLQRSVFPSLTEFSRMTKEVMGNWAGAASATDEETKASKACNIGETALPATEGALKNLSASRAMLETNGFTPYVVIFVAQALSALDDHGAAVALLVDWLTDLDEIEKATKERKPADSQRQFAWYRLQVMIEVLVLQKLSENSPNGVPATLPALRTALNDLFPAVLRSLVDHETLSGWRHGSSLCRAPDQRWKQGIILSYLSWVKEYLDLLQQTLAKDASRLQSQDLKRADLLLDINLECFDWILVSEEKRRSNSLDLPIERATSQVEFATTAAAIWMLLHEADRARGAAILDRGRHLAWAGEKLRGALEKLTALGDHDKTRRPARESEYWERLVRTEPNQELLSNAQAVLNRIEIMRGQR